MIVNSQSQLNDLLKENPNRRDLELKSGRYELKFGFVTACGSSQVRACGSSQVTACGSSQVTACDSSQVRAYDSSQVRACGSSQVTAYGSSQVRATNYVAISINGKNVKATGGVKIMIPKITTAIEWCNFYGVEVKRNKAILFKGLNNNFISDRGSKYVPGTKTIASDWDGGILECGGGLHFSPRPFMTLRFATNAKRFVACEVKLKDIAVHPNGVYPDKVKAKCCKNLYEVDLNGNKKS